MKLAVIGAGQMGHALIRAFSDSFLKAADIGIYDIAQDRAASIANETGCFHIEKIDDKLADYDAVLLSVKPQHISEVVLDIVSFTSKKCLFMSIAAGKSLHELQMMSLENRPLVRIMPNTPALVGSAVSGISFAKNVNETQKKWVLDLFSSCGLVFELPEKLLDAVTGLSGSGPAYMMLVMEAMADGGVREGLSRETALEMAAMTMLGSARLVLESGRHPAILKDQVCSPAGTTIEAVSILEAKGLRSALIEAVSASAEKSRKLGAIERNTI